MPRRLLSILSDPSNMSLLALLVLVALPATSAVPATAAEVDVPAATAPVIDGTWAPEEWDGARRLSLGDGELRLLQADGSLYLGIRHPALGLATVCLVRGSEVHRDEVQLLHASAALGTGVYRAPESDSGGEDHEAGLWTRTRTFEWTARGSDGETREQQQALLAQDLWRGSNVRTGVKEEMELEIRWPHEASHLRLAVAVLLLPDYDRVIAWPAEVSDNCTDIEVGRGRLPETGRFAVEEWAVVR